MNRCTPLPSPYTPGWRIARVATLMAPALRGNATTPLPGIPQ